MANRYTNPIRQRFAAAQTQISPDVGLTALELWRQCFSEVFDKRLDPSDVPIEFSIVNVDIAYEDIMRKSRHKRRHSNITPYDLHL